MEKIDFHIHSTNSDGELSPRGVMQQAIKNNVSLISITDHDIYFGQDYWKEMLLPGKKIKLVPGAELSTDYYKNGEKIRIHLLAYDVKDNNNELGHELSIMRRAREEGNFQYVKALKKSCNFIIDDDFADFDFSQYGRINKLILKQLTAKKILSSEQIEKIQQFFLENKPKYSKCTLDIERGIEIVKANGGITSFAHPYQTKLNFDDLDHLVKYLKSVGLDAIEGYHGEANSQDNNIAIFLAQKHDLYKSAGSDFHSTKDVHDIGCDTSDYPNFNTKRLDEKFIKEQRFLSDEVREK